MFNKGGMSYYVPEYQRGFEWEQENFEDLWSDIQQIGQRTEEHYLSNIILLKTPNDTFEIVDGQQRMVSLSILLMAIRDELGESNDDDRRIDEVLNTYPEKDAERRMKLFNKEDDNAFYELWEGNTEKVEGQVGKAYNLFSKYISETEKDCEDIIERILNDLTVVETRAEDSSLAYMIFQTQNERGTEVSPEVLIKARIHGEADRLNSDARAKPVKEKWATICATLEEELGRPRFPEDQRVRKPITHILLTSEVETPTEITKDSLYRNFDNVL